MKTLIVTQYFWPETFRINTVAEALHRAGCEVTVLTGQPNYPDGTIFKGYRAWRSDRELHPAGYEIFRLPLIPRGNKTALTLTLNYLSCRASSILVGQWRLRKKEFDVVFVYGTSPVLQALAGAFFSSRKRAALIVWVQDLWPESLSATGYVKNPYILRRVAGLVRWIYHRCDLLLVQSRSFVDSTCAMAGEVPVVYYPNPGDVERTPPERPRNPVSLPSGFNVTFSGNLGTVQSVETIVEVAEHLRDEPHINFVILGSGSRLGWIQREIKRRALANVYLLGRVEPAVANDAMARSDALLITLKNVEALNKTVPSKLSTYFGIGRPVLACMDGEGAEVVKASGAGITCEAENAERLAALILELRSMPQAARDEMGMAGRRWYEKHFELMQLTDVLVDHFKQAMNGRDLKSTKEAMGGGQ